MDFSSPQQILLKQILGSDICQVLTSSRPPAQAQGYFWPVTDFLKHVGTNSDGLNPFLFCFWELEIEPRASKIGVL